MKKTLIIAALIVGLILFAGESIHFLGRTYVGDKAPSFVLPKVDSTVVLDNLKGEYTLINFWNSTDAVSRREANRYRAWKRRYPQSPLVVIGVNFDESEALFHEIVRLDSLEPAKQFHAAGDTACACKPRRQSVCIQSERQAARRYFCEAMKGIGQKNDTHM